MLPVAQSAIPQDDSGEDWVYLNVGKDGKLLVSNEDLSTPAKLRIFLLKRKEEIENLAAFRGVKPESLAHYRHHQRSRGGTGRQGLGDPGFLRKGRLQTLEGAGANQRTPEKVIL